MGHVLATGLRYYSNVLLLYYKPDVQLKRETFPWGLVPRAISGQELVVVPLRAIFILRKPHSDPHRRSLSPMQIHVYHVPEAPVDRETGQQHPSALKR